MGRMRILIWDNRRSASSAVCPTMLKTIKLAPPHQRQFKNACGTLPETADAFSVQSKVLSIRLCDGNVVTILNKDPHRRGIFFRIAAAKPPTDHFAQTNRKRTQNSSNLANP
jgi:hypothetical protein